MSVLEQAAAVARHAGGIGDVSQWADDRLEFAPESILLCSVAHLDYKEWCRTQKMRPVGMAAMSRAIVAVGVERYRSPSTRGFFGLRIKAPSELALAKRAGMIERGEIESGPEGQPAPRVRRVLADLNPVQSPMPDEPL